MNPRLAFSTLQLATFVLAVYSAASSSSPSSLLSKSIVGGSTELKQRPEEASTLFGVTRKNKGPEDESIYVVKRDGSKEPLEKKKVGLCKFYWVQKSKQLLWIVFLNHSFARYHSQLDFGASPKLGCRIPWKGRKDFVDNPRFGIIDGLYHAGHVPRCEFLWDRYSGGGNSR